jgi:hypothetical protein
MLGYVAGAPLRAFWSRFVLRQQPATTEIAGSQT